MIGEKVPEMSNFITQTSCKEKYLLKVDAYAGVYTSWCLCSPVVYMFMLAYLKSFKL